MASLVQKLQHLPDRVLELHRERSAINPKAENPKIWKAGAQNIQFVWLHIPYIHTFIGVGEQLFGMFNNNTLGNDRP